MQIMVDGPKIVAKRSFYDKQLRGKCPLRIFFIEKKREKNKKFKILFDNRSALQRICTPMVKMDDVILLAKDQ
jgi:hypothetical protein